MANDLSIYRTYGPGWWDGHEPFLRLLKNLVAVRMRYFDRVVPLWRGTTVVDVGCGGGFMAEALRRRGARVAALDPELAALAAGRRHALEAGLRLVYLAGRGETLPLTAACADAVVCVDVLEHVEDPERVVAEVRRVLRPGGCFLFDTINRTALARFVVVTLGEVVLRLLPRGTHDPARFIRPDELRRCLEAEGFEAGKVVGLGPVGLDRRLDLTFGRLPSTAVLYLGHAVRRP